MKGKHGKESKWRKLMVLSLAVMMALVFMPTGVLADGTAGTAAQEQKSTTAEVQENNETTGTGTADSVKMGGQIQPDRTSALTRRMKTRRQTRQRIRLRKLLTYNRSRRKRLQKISKIRILSLSTDRDIQRCRTQ